MSQWEEDTPHGHPLINTPWLSLRVPPSVTRVLFYSRSVRVVTPVRTPTSTAEYLLVIDVKDAHARTLYEWSAKKKKFAPRSGEKKRLYYVPLSLFFISPMGRFNLLEGQF